ncbi:hypothetical protein ACFTXJ_15410 [Streptomyces zhihengii]|uniref:hypothetical protein n=1 Tax=Streptomyces zhihengii TaxID=1818004 RepID=UPI00363E5D6E
MHTLEHPLRPADARTRPGFGAWLPVLATEEHDRRRLDWLPRRMMNDPENPLPHLKARTLRRITVAPPERARTHGEERYG